MNGRLKAVPTRGRWFLVAMCFLTACQIVGGDGGDDGGEAGGNGPVVDPNVELGSVALTASCDSSDGGQVQSLSLEGSYDCDENFLVNMTNEGESVGPVRMHLALGDVEAESEGPMPGPTMVCEDAGQPPSDSFRLDSADADGGSCRLGETTAVCDLEPLSGGASVAVTLEICPAPEVATVTTEVVLERLS